MDAATVVMTTGAAMVVAHCAIFGSEMISSLRHVGTAVLHGLDGYGSNELLEEALWDAKFKQFRSSSRVCVHIATLCTLGQLLQLRWNDNAHSLWPLGTAMMAWAMHLLISSNTVQLNRLRCRILILAMHILMALFLYGNPGDCQNARILTGIAVAIRFAIAALFVDLQSCVPGQTILGLLETWNAWKRDPHSVQISFVQQLTIIALVVFVAGIMEFNNRSRTALLTNSESMILSFRRVLRGVCDGEVLLDSKLRISGKASCLQTLLMTSDADFCNRSFEDLLMDDERERFRGFMSEQQAAGSSISAPSCLRVSLKRSAVAEATSSACPRLGVDLFHVPHMLGEETYHLLALREDSEAISPPEASGDSRVIPARLAHDDRRTRSIPLSDSSVSQVSGRSILQICSELEEMTLLVDASTSLLDVEQAHLSFVRRPESDSETMPSLRRLVQPTDWGTIHTKLSSFAEASSSANGSHSKEALKTKLRLQNEYRNCVEARHVEVSVFSPVTAQGSEPCKLCLQLGDFKVLRSSLHVPLRSRSELQGVDECQSEDSNHS